MVYQAQFIALDVRVLIVLIGATKLRRRANRCWQNIIINCSKSGSINEWGGGGATCWIINQWLARDRVQVNDERSTVQRLPL